MYAVLLSLLNITVNNVLIWSLIMMIAFVFVDISHDDNDVHGNAFVWWSFRSVLEQSMKITKVDCISAITPFLFLSLQVKYKINKAWKC